MVPHPSRPTGSSQLDNFTANRQVYQGTYFSPSGSVASSISIDSDLPFGSYVADNTAPRIAVFQYHLGHPETVYSPKSLTFKPTNQIVISLLTELSGENSCSIAMNLEIFIFPNYQFREFTRSCQTRRDTLLRSSLFEKSTAKAYSAHIQKNTYQRHIHQLVM